uniref:cDNA FLJ50349, moderately similar to Betaine--homocysteine S-methyltransferase n=1 Tax=Homo sapiens TaxID=9606 RepID=B4E1C7_HUMAN|nr:unnamed protein product [Homo sapiens]
MPPVGGKKAKKGILERLNAGEIVIGDGGFVFALEKRGYVKAGPWTPEAAVEHPEAGASIIGVNCHFDPTISLKTVKLMKEGLEAARLKAHLMSQPLAYHTPDCNKQGFIDLPEFPFGLEPELPPDGIFKNTPERPTTWGSGTLAGAVDLSPTTSGQLQRSWPQKGAFCHQLQKNMAAGEVVWTCTPNPGLEQGPGRNTGRIFG